METDCHTAIVGALYHHPPKPCYNIDRLYDHVERSLEELLEMNVGASVILGGDFNQLKVSEITERTGVIPLVSVPTRGAKSYTYGDDIHTIPIHHQCIGIHCED